MPLPPLIAEEGYSLTERVYRSLRAGILLLQIKPREQLIIGDIAREYGISRTPVREALLMLEHEGWVETDGRRGAKVTAPSVERILELAEMQAVLEAYIAGRAADCFTEDDLRRADAILDQAEQAIQAGELDRARQLAVEFDTCLNGKVTNQHIHTTIAQLTEHLERIRPLLWQPGSAPLLKSLQQHRDVLEAIRARDAVKAERLMFRHTIWFEEEIAGALRHV